MTNLLDLFQHILEPMRRPEPTRLCPTLADNPLDGNWPHGESALRETVRVDLATFRRIRLEMRGA
jgi:hypothetical protein